MYDAKPPLFAVFVSLGEGYGAAADKRRGEVCGHGTRPHSQLQERCRAEGKAIPGIDVYDDNGRSDDRQFIIYLNRKSFRLVTFAIIASTESFLANLMIWHMLGTNWRVLSVR